jgi:RNA polymerase sigma-54 factor
MKHSLQLRLSQHLTLTPQLQQSIRLLQLSTLELNQELERMLQENPLLEREDSPGEQPAADAPPRASESPAASEAAPAEEPAGEAAPAEAGDGDVGALDDAPLSGYRDDAEDGEHQQVAADAPTLRGHLLSQLSLTSCPSAMRAWSGSSSTRWTRTAISRRASTS